MSTSPEHDFDLEKLFLPAWAQEPSSAKLYSHYEGEEERPDRRGPRRGARPPRRDRPDGQRRDADRARGERRRGPERGGPRGKPFGDERPGFKRGEFRPRREPPPPMPEIELALLPDEKGVESLARQIKTAGRAYPLFEIAQMILQKPERHSVSFRVKKNAEGQPLQKLFVCALDDTLWLSEEATLEHVLKKHLSTFYQAERTATEPPKGKYTFVAQCGISGVVLGPPNHHDYQNQLRKLHAERFSRMPFETYKSRVKIVRDEAVVKKWVDDQSWKTEYICLNLPEPLRLANMEAVEKHFRETHKENIIKPVESHTLSGTAARSSSDAELGRLVRSVWEDQRRFPLPMATVLSQQFAALGLQFFKVNKTVTHVCVARPHYLDMEATPVSEGVKRIVEFVNARPKCNRRDLVEALAPSPSPAPADRGASAAEPQGAEPRPEQTAVIADLHWLIHQGHVIEFANGSLETAKKPIPKPPKPQAKPAEPALQSEPVQAIEPVSTEPATVVPPSSEEPAAETLAPEAAEVPPEAASPTQESLASEAPASASETPVEPEPTAVPPPS